MPLDGGMVHADGCLHVLEQRPAGLAKDHGQKPEIPDAAAEMKS